MSTTVFTFYKNNNIHFSLIRKKKNHTLKKIDCACAGVSANVVRSCDDGFDGRVIDVSNQ